MEMMDDIMRKEDELGRERACAPHGLCPQSRLQALDGFVPLLLVFLLQGEERLPLQTTQRS